MDYDLVVLGGGSAGYAAALAPPPERTAAGYRDYPPEIISRLAFIRRSQGAGLTLAQIREVPQIRDGGEPRVSTCRSCSATD